MHAGSLFQIYEHNLKMHGLQKSHSKFLAQRVVMSS